MSRCDYDQAVLAPAEAFASVSEADFNDVMLEIAQEREAEQVYSDWSDEDQKAWEAEQDRLKNRTGNYSPINGDDTYEGIAI